MSDSVSASTRKAGAPADDLTDFVAGVATQVETFLLALREIARAESPDQSVSLLLLEVSQVMLAGGRLGAIADVVPDDRWEPDVGPDPDLDELRDRLGVLLEPIDEYVAVFDPYAADTELVHTRLSDDLAAVAAALAHGLRHYKDDRVNEALWWWQFSYLNSWGSHAGMALRALHSVVAHSRLDTLADDTVEFEDRLLAEVAAEALTDR